MLRVGIETVTALKFHIRARVCYGPGIDSDQCIYIHTLVPNAMRVGAYIYYYVSFFFSPAILCTETVSSLYLRVQSLHSPRVWHRVAYRLLCVVGVSYGPGIDSGRRT